MDLIDPILGVAPKAELASDGTREDGFPLRPEIDGGKSGFIWASHAELAPEGGREGDYPLRVELEGKNFRPEMYGGQTSPVELPADLPASPYIGDIKKPPPTKLKDGEEIKSPYMKKAKTITESSERRSFDERSRPIGRLVRRVPVPDRTRDQEQPRREVCRIPVKESPKYWI